MNTKQISVWAIVDEQGILTGVITSDGAPKVYLCERASAEDVAILINGGNMPVISPQSKSEEHG